MSDTYNPEPVANIADDFIAVMETCLENKEIYQSNKEEMLNIVRTKHPIFYSNYFRLCKSAVDSDVGPLIAQMKAFYKVQMGQLDFNKAGELLTEATNNTYVNPVLNSDKLKQERAKKK